MQGGRAVHSATLALTVHRNTLLGAEAGVLRNL